MTVDEITQDCDDHGFTDTSSTRKIAMLNETYWDCLGREAWPFLENTASLNFAGGVATSSNDPGDISATLALYRTSDGKKLTPWRLDDLLERYASNLTLAGDPFLYYFEGSTLKFYPQPPAGTGSVVVKYIRTPAALAAGGAENTILLPKQYHRGVLVNGTLEKLYAMDDDTDTAVWFERKFEKAMDRMREDLWIRTQYDTPDYIHPVDPQDFDDYDF